MGREIQNIAEMDWLSEKIQSPVKLSVLTKPSGLDQKYKFVFENRKKRIY
jgi:hypothetical protein